MNIIARLEYELAYYDSAVHRFNHYTTRPFQGGVSWMSRNPCAAKPKNASSRRHPLIGAPQTPRYELSPAKQILLGNSTLWDNADTRKRLIPPTRARLRRWHIPFLLSLEPTRTSARLKNSAVIDNWFYSRDKLSIFRIHFVWLWAKTFLLDNV